MHSHFFSSCSRERHMLPQVLYTWSTCPRSSEPEHQSSTLLAPNKLLFYVWLCCWELCFLSSHHLNQRTFLNLTATKDELSPCKVNFYFSAGSHWPRWAWKCCCLVNGWASFGCWYPHWNCCSAWLSICFNFLLAAGVRRPKWVYSRDSDLESLAQEGNDTEDEGWWAAFMPSLIGWEGLSGWLAF